MILDDRVLKSLNRTLGITTRELSDSRRWADRYESYVQAMHWWASELSGTDLSPQRLEWILFLHNGDPDTNALHSR